ncbi:DUF4113 domain-containing protein [Amycolatopsis sp. cmx-4-61]|uniref:DUF4113 domain-containing protein n=1 Tax=Amycolatopsis sp. cmx-4-61 TaxID=2790937 RepID=UPI00397D8A69
MPPGCAGTREWAMGQQYLSPACTTRRDQLAVARGAAGRCTCEGIRLAGDRRAARSHELAETALGTAVSVAAAPTARSRQLLRRTACRATG